MITPPAIACCFAYLVFKYSCMHSLGTMKSLMSIIVVPWLLILYKWSYSLLDGQYGKVCTMKQFIIKHRHLAFKMACYAFRILWILSVFANFIDKMFGNYISNLKNRDNSLKSNKSCLSVSKIMITAIN